jgi:hypothetical protein
MLRNKEWYKSRKAKTIQAERRASHIREDIQQHFDNFQRCLKEWGLQPEDVYNFDETGFRIGCLNGRTVITHQNTKEVYLSNPDNRELVSAVECISASGKAIQPMIIIAGAVFLEKHFDNDLHDDVLFAVSDSGYSNDTLGFEWLKHFNKQTKKSTTGLWRMIIFDGHGSHLSSEFLYYC